MSVIIRLQNLPWSANALDIRGFFRGLSIPDGGVHIVGGEMGDAFIAFSTDEDARQAMMLDRGKLKEVQIRLLLSSRAEMQKVIETARQSSLSMMQITAAPVKVEPILQQTLNQSRDIPQPPIITSSTLSTILAAQNPPKVPGTHSFHLYGNNQKSLNEHIESRDNREKHAFEASEKPRNKLRGTSKDRRTRSKSRTRSRDRRRSTSRDRGSSRRRRSRSRSRSRDHRSRRRRSRSRSRARSKVRDRGDRNRDKDSKERESEKLKEKDRSHGEKNSYPLSRNLDNAGKRFDEDAPPSKQEGKYNAAANGQNISIWEVPPQPVASINVTPRNYSTVSSSTVPINNTSPFDNSALSLSSFMSQSMNDRPFGNFSKPPPFNNSGASINNVLNYHSMPPTSYPLPRQVPTPISNSHASQFPPKTLASDFPPTFTSSSNSSFIFGMDSKPAPPNHSVFTHNQNVSSLQNPYMVAKSNPKYATPSTNFPAPFYGDKYANGDEKKTLASRSSLHSIETTLSSPKTPDFKDFEEINYEELEGNCIMLTNMFPSTSYSELRRFFSGLYIANNGIKMINDKHGLRTGTAYIRFVRKESKPKAFAKNGTMLKGKRVKISSVTEEDFDAAVDSFRPVRNFGRNRLADENEPSSIREEDDYQSISRESSESITISSVLLVDELPPFAKQQDIMKMFSSYSLLDISFLPHPDKAKKNVCYVRFLRSEDAKNAFLDRKNHLIAHKQVLVLPFSEEEFQSVKRLNERLEIESKANDPSLASNMVALDVQQDQTDDEKEGIKCDSETENGSQTKIVFTELKCGNADGNANLNQNEILGSPNQNNEIPSLFSLKPIPPPMFENPRERLDQDAARTIYVMLHNCDYRASQQDFAALFSDLGILPNRIEIILNRRNQPSGQCIVEFNCSEHAQLALSKNNAYVGKRNVKIELIPVRTVVNILGERFLDFAPHQKSAYDHSHVNSNSNPISPGIISNSTSDDILNSSRRHGFRENNQQKTNVDSSLNQRSTRFSESNSRDNSGRFANNDTGKIKNSKALVGDAITDQFGQPGCVVGLENVPYIATVEDILNYFSNFDISPENVIRRYNDDGSPTGDARVAFESPMDAELAVATRQKGKIANRTIYLSIV